MSKTYTSALVGFGMAIGTCWGFYRTHECVGTRSQHEGVWEPQHHFLFLFLFPVTTEELWPLFLGNLVSVCMNWRAHYVDHHRTRLTMQELPGRKSVSSQRVRGKVVTPLSPGIISWCWPPGKPPTTTARVKGSGVKWKLLTSVSPHPEQVVETPSSCLCAGPDICESFPVGLEALFLSYETGPLIMEALMPIKETPGLKLTPSVLDPRSPSDCITPCRAGVSNIRPATCRAYISVHVKKKK